MFDSWQHQSAKEKRKVLPRGSQASAAGGRFIALASQGKCTLDRRRKCFADKKEGTLISNFVPVQILGWCRVRTGISLLHFKSQAVPSHNELVNCFDCHCRPLHSKCGKADRSLAVGRVDFSKARPADCYCEVLRADASKTGHRAVNII